MKVLSRDDVIAVVGSVYDALIAEVAATGTTRSELAEAHAWTMSDEALAPSATLKVVILPVGSSSSSLLSRLREPAREPFEKLFS